MSNEFKIFRYYEGAEYNTVYEKIDTLIQSEYLKLLNENSKNIPPLIYHYCNSAAFLSILENKEIWASYCECMNDKSELTYGKKVLLEYMENIKNTGDDFERIIAEYIIHHAGNLFGDREIKKGLYCIFAAAFSEEGDLLSQWRGYTNGEGFSLGINTSEIPRVSKISFEEKHQILLKVIYQRKEQDLILTGVFQEFVNVLRGALPGLHINKLGHSNINEENMVTIVGSLFLAFYELLAAIFKDVCFSEEKEWRLIRLVYYESIMCHFRVNSNKEILPYHKIKLSNKDSKYRKISNGSDESIEIKNSEYIGEVIFGPKLNIEVTLKMIRLFIFKHYFIDIDERQIVRQSRIPLR